MLSERYGTGVDGGELRGAVELESLFSQGIQPGGGLDLFLQQVFKIGADIALYLAGKLAIDFNAAGTGVVVSLEEPQDFLGVDGKGVGERLIKAAVRAEHAAGGGAEIVGGGLQSPVAGNAFPHLGAIAGAFQEMKLEVAKDQLFIIYLAESVESVQHKLKERVILLVLGGELVDKLGDVQSAGGKPEVVLDGEESVNGLGADNCEKISPAGKRYCAVR